MPEAVRAVERETDVVDGAPLFVEREAARRVVGALERRAANPDEGDGLDADADFVPQLRLHDVRQPELPADVRKCGRCRDELPPRDAPADGRARRGKSVALAQIVTQARARGWLCLFVARARDVGPPRRLRRAVAPHHAGRFEAAGAAEVLEAFREAHGTDLATVKCTDAAAELVGGATLRGNRGRRPRRQEARRRGVDGAGRRRRRFEGARRGAGIDRGRRVLGALRHDGLLLRRRGKPRPTTSCTSARCGAEMPACAPERRLARARTCSPTRSRAAAPASGRATGASASPTRPSRSPSASLWEPRGVRRAVDRSLRPRASAPRTTSRRSSSRRSARPGAAAAERLARDVNDDGGSSIGHRATPDPA